MQLMKCYVKTGINFFLYIIKEKVNAINVLYATNVLYMLFIIQPEKKK